MVVRRELRIGVNVRLDLRQHGPQRRILVRVALKVLELHRAVHERTRDAVLDAKLRVERRQRVGTVGVIQAALVRPRFDARNVIGFEIMLAHQHQHGVDRRMRAAAARVLLDGDARLDDVPGFAPGRQDFFHVVIAGAVEHFEVALLVLEGDGAGGEAVARQQRGEISFAAINELQYPLALLSMALCNDATLRHFDDTWHLVGDPTEGALVALAAKGDVDIDATRQAHPRLAEVPFDSANKFMATVHEVVELGTLDPETVVTPGLFVQRVVRIDRQATQAGGFKERA